jgi:hypothetical protein
MEDAMNRCTSLIRESTNPTRLPHWRWHLAEMLVEGWRRPPRSGIEDPWLQLALAYLKACHGPHTKPARKRSYSTLPAVAVAAAVFRDGGVPRARLEAWLLTGESLEGIAETEELPPEAVEAYHALFYAVREFSGAEDATLAAIGRSAQAAPDGLGPLGVALRTLACRGQQDGLKCLLAAVEECRQLLGDEDCQRPLPESLSSVHLALLLNTTPLEEMSLKQWFALTERGRVYERLKRERLAIEEVLAHGACQNLPAAWIEKEPSVAQAPDALASSTVGVA